MDIHNKTNNNTQYIISTPTKSNNKLKRKKSLSGTDKPQPFEVTEMDADSALDTKFLRFARRHPKTYLKIVGHLIVFSELIALLTPSVAMGIQWVTALCDGPPVLSILELLGLFFTCSYYGDCSMTQSHFSHCILKNN